MKLKRLLCLARHRGRDRAADQSHRVVEEDAARGAVGAAKDASAGRVRRRRGDARELQPELVAPERVRVDAHQRRRVPRRGGAEHGGVGKIAAGPKVLVPAIAADPLAGGGRLRVARHALHAVLLAGCAGEPHLHEVAPVQERMSVRVREPGHCAAFPQLDELDVGARLALALLPRADPREFPFAHQRGLRARPRGVHGVQPSDDEEVGH